MHLPDGVELTTRQVPTESLGNSLHPLYGFISLALTEALKMEEKKPEKPSFAALMKGGTDPYKCILCGERLRFAGAPVGLYATE